MHSLIIFLIIYNLDIFIGVTSRNTCEDQIVTCPCGKSGKSVSIPVKQCATNRLCKPCQDESAICKTFENCYECRSDITNRCSLCPQARGGTFCDQVLGCQTLMQPANGDIQPFVGSPFGSREGEEVRYSCFRGFSLTAGSVTRRCRKDGSWSGVEPVCVPGNGREPMKKCFSPPKIANSRVTVIKDKATYICEPNFTLVGNRVIICENGEWSSFLPRCEKNVEKSTMCPPVEPVERAKVELILKNVLPSTIRKTEAELADQILGPYPEGTQLLYSCESNFYNQIGPRNRTCINGRWTGRPPMCTPVCGQSNKPRTPLIINGSASEIGQWPWAVVIKRLIDDQWDFTCGGSLITERMIITAAHCVTRKGLKSTFPSADFKLYVGKHYLDDARDDIEVQVRNANEVFVHPDYNPFSLDSDVGLIGVIRSFRLTNRVQPVCLPEPYEIDFRNNNGRMATVIGWGFTEKKQTANVLINLEVPIISTEKCRREYSKKGIGVTDNMICAGYEDGGRDTCSGDSGGALMLPLDRNKQRWVMEGIVSWGGSPDSECAKAEEYGSYVKVINFVEWINQFMF